MCLHTATISSSNFNTLLKDVCVDIIALAQGVLKLQAYSSRTGVKWLEADFTVWGKILKNVFLNQNKGFSSSCMIKITKYQKSFPN